MPRFQLADPLAVVQSTTVLAQHAAASLAVTLQLDLPSMLPEIVCDPEQIKQVLLKLMLNALQASEHGGSVQVRVNGNQEQLSIEFCDEGHGISEKS